MRLEIRRLVGFKRRITHIAREDKLMDFFFDLRRVAKPSRIVFCRGIFFGRVEKRHADKRIVKLIFVDNVHVCG